MTDDLPKLPPRYRWRVRYTYHPLLDSLIEYSLKYDGYFVEIVYGRLFKSVVEYDPITDRPARLKNHDANEAVKVPEDVTAERVVDAARRAFKRFSTDYRNPELDRRVSGFYPPNTVKGLK